MYIPQCFTSVGVVQEEIDQMVRFWRETAVGGALPPRCALLQSIYVQKKLGAFDCHCGCFAAANADGGDAAFLVGGFKGVQEGHEDTCA